MTLIRLSEPERLSLDGIHVDEFEAGAEIDAPVRMAASLVEQGRAEYVGDAPALPAAPDVPASGAEADTAASEGDAGGADAPAASEGAEGAGERPSVDAPRKALDAYAATLGLDTSKLPNKAAVNDALDAALSWVAS